MDRSRAHHRQIRTSRLGAARRRENPRLPAVIPGGAPNNPMGQFAMTLGDGTYAIHGTNRPASVGRFVSHGCIRMYNADIRELFSMVAVGTPVIVER